MYSLAIWQSQLSTLCSLPHFLAEIQYLGGMLSQFAFLSSHLQERDQTQHLLSHFAHAHQVTQNPSLFVCHMPYAVTSPRTLRTPEGRGENANDLAYRSSLSRSSKDIIIVGSNAC